MHNLLPHILFGIGTIFICLFFYSLFKKRNRLASLFSLLCILMSIYVIGYALELMSSDLQHIKFYLTLKYFGFSFIPTLWMMLSYKFYFNKDMSIRIGVLISIIPFLAIFLNATNDFHHLYYTDISLIYHNGIVLAYITKGTWYCIYLLYSYLSVLIGGYIFFIAWKQERYNVKTQSFWLFFGTLFPVGASVINSLGLGPPGYDILPFSFITIGVTYFIVLFKYDFLELKEIVRGYAFGQINEGIVVIDVENRIIDFNNSGQKTFDWLNAQNIGKSILLFDDGKRIMDNSRPFFEIQINKEGGSKCYEFRVTSLKENGEIVGSVFLFQDITEQKLAIDRLNYIATYDTLSEIYNRNKLMDAIEKALYDVKRHGNIFTILMLDIDYFKNINDKYGHIVGDMAIKYVAQGCTTRLRSDDIIGRYGGEEFIAILPKTEKAEAVTIAEDIRQYISNLEMHFNETNIKVTISIGVVAVTEENKHITPNELINEVDKALYVAKSSGRNKVCTL